MISVRDYILLIMEKKKMTRADLCRKLNEVEKKLGEPLTRRQNITNYLNGYTDFNYRTLMRYELALELEPDTLVNMVQAPTSKEGIKEFNDYKRRIRNGNKI